jgi:hypothetical protein
VKRTTRIDVRVTPEEKRCIDGRARAHGYPTTKFLREGGLLGRVQPVLSIHLQQWARLAGLMANLNQLTRLANAGTIRPDLAAAILETRDMVAAIRQDLITKREAQK